VKVYLARVDWKDGHAFRAPPMHISYDANTREYLGGCFVRLTSDEQLKQHLPSLRSKLGPDAP
jgi:hypothetical protein